MTSIYSCDDHLDLSAVPPGLWESRLPAADAERGPRGREAATRRAVWVCEDRGDRPQRHAAERASSVKKFSAIGRAGIDDDGYRAGTPKLRLEDMDRDGLRGVGDLRAAVARLPDRGSRVAGRVLRSVERLGGRGVQRGRSRPAVRARVPAQSFARGRRGRARAVRGARPPRRDRRRRSTSTSATRRGTALWSAAERTGLPISFHIKGGTSSKLSYRIGKWQSAAFATLLPLQLDEPLATMVFCGSARAAPRLQARARGVGRRLVAVLPDAHGSGVERRSRDKLDYAPEIAAE